MRKYIFVSLIIAIPLAIIMATLSARGNTPEYQKAAIAFIGNLSAKNISTSYVQLTKSARSKASEMYWSQSIQSIPANSYQKPKLVNKYEVQNYQKTYTSDKVPMVVEYNTNYGGKNITLRLVMVYEDAVWKIDEITRI